MRFEAKHNYFKNVAQRVKCFKNITKTLADRHQKQMCYYLSNPNISPLVKEMKVPKGNHIALNYNNYNLAIHVE